MNTTVSLNNNKSDRLTNLFTHTTISPVTNLQQEVHLTPVYLNLYDLGGCINACVHSIGLSFYHCAVQIHLAEYGYMGHPYKFTGLYKTSKHDSRFHLYQLRDSLEIGWTWHTEKDIDQIVDHLKSFYLGYDYHTIDKNSTHFARYLLEQISNDPQKRHLKPINIIKFPSHIDRSRHMCRTFQFLQMFDREKDIAEINILYFLYMNYEGDLKQICQALACDTVDGLQRCIELIEQGIQQKRLPIFSIFTQYQMKTTYDYFDMISQINANIKSGQEPLTLTDIFHEFDTVTLRGRTSIDRCLNMEQTGRSVLPVQHEDEQRSMLMKSIEFDRRNDAYNHQQSLNSSNIAEIPRISATIKNINHSQHVNPIKQSIEKYRLSFQKYDENCVSQNQDHTSLGSLMESHHISKIVLNSTSQSYDTPRHSSGVTQSNKVLNNQIYKFESSHRHQLLPYKTVRRQQHQKSNSDNISLSKFRLKHDDNHRSFSKIVDRQHQQMHTSHKRKLPRDIELTNDLYTIVN